MAVTHLSISCTKSKNVSKQQQHHTERFDDSRQHRNKMINPEKSKDNINLRPDLEGSYQDRFESIVNSDRYKGRRKKDGTPVIAENGKNAATKMIQVTVNIGRADENGKRLDDLSDDEITELLKNDVYPMMKDWFGGDANVIGAAIHRDESKPHLHLDIVPITEDGKLSAKKMLGNENNMRFHQKEWLEKMQERRPDLNFSRKQNSKTNGLEMEKLKELTAIAEERGNDTALNVLMSMRKQDEAELNKKREQLAITEKELSAKADEIAEGEQKNNAVRDELNAFVKPLKSTAEKLAKQERAQNERERALNERERGLNAEVSRKVNERTRERMQALDVRESQLDETASKLVDERTRERMQALDVRESQLDETVSKLVDERTRERMQALDVRESRLDETASKLADERTRERTRALDIRESQLDKEVESRVAKIKHAVVGAFKQLPKIKDTLVAYMTKAREKDEEERKAREEQAQKLAEITDKKTEQLANAIEQEDVKQVAKHTEHLEQINEVANEIDESQFDMSAGTLEDKIDDFDFEIDESQFDMSNQRQQTL